MAPLELTNAQWPLGFGIVVGLVHVSGFHTNGWWVGDGTEDLYVGPRGAHVSVFLDSATPLYAQWGNALQLTHAGPFSATLPLHLGGSVAGWDFLRDGTTDLRLMNASRFFRVKWTASPSP